ncbi:Imm1 family immunity protein [Micromonospora sp. SH-82]|uniref:Imm1 family immunity protein n=1 Tax=Micromonospora sp. SH-82 TaxID=3132938 RepID=UPI003EC033E7
MKVTWTYDRGDHRDNHETDVTEPAALETLLGEIHQAGEPVVVTIFSDTADDPDDLPPGLQVGLGHPTHAFAVHIADTDGHLTRSHRHHSTRRSPLRLRRSAHRVPRSTPPAPPRAAMQIAATFVQSGGAPPHVPDSSEQPKAAEHGSGGYRRPAS